LAETPPLSFGKNIPFVNWQKHSLFRLVKISPLSIGRNTPPLSIGRNTPPVNWQKHPLFRLVKIFPLSIGRNTPFVNWQERIWRLRKRYEHITKEQR